MSERIRPAQQIGPTAIAAAMVVGSASILILGMIPIVLGSLAAGGRLSQAGVGHAATLETIGIALGAMVGPFWMERGAIRVKSAALALALLLANVATIYADDAAAILFDRTLAGLLSGLLLGAANVIIVRANNPDRLSGILLGVSMVPQIAAAYLMPVLLTPLLGPAAGFHVLAVGAGLACLCAFGLTDRVRPVAVEAAGRTPLSPALLLFSAAIVVQGCGFGTAWAYVERAGEQHGFSPALAGVAVSLSLACQVAGAWISAWLSPKLPKWPMLLGLVALQAVFMTLMILAQAPWVFILAVCAFGAAPPAMQPFQVAELIRLEPTRRAAALLGAMILIGNGLGPLLTSSFMTESDVYGGLWMASAITVGSALLYVLSALAQRSDRLATA